MPKYAQPFQPNAGVEAWYRTQLQAIVHEMAQDMLDEVRRAWAAGGLALDGAKLTPAVMLDRAFAKWGGLWIHRIESTARKISLQFATRSKRATEVSMRQQLKAAGFTVKFKPTRAIRSAFDAVAAANVGLIKSIPTKYLTDVQGVVWEGVASGGNLTAVADQLAEKYGIAHRRAAFIAKDQNHKAKAAIERAQRLELGIVRAKWHHSHAGEVPRPTHVKMSGETYEVATGMWDSAVGKYIWPATEPHCRCTDSPEIPGFD